MPLLLESAVIIEKVVYGLRVGGFLTLVIVIVKVDPEASPLLTVNAFDIVRVSVPVLELDIEVTKVGLSLVLETLVT